MFMGFCWRPDETLQSFSTPEELRAVWTSPDVRIWIDIDQPTSASLHEIDSIVDVDDTSLEACLDDQEQRPRVDEFDDHIFLLLYGVLAPSEDPTFAPRRLAAFLGSRFLVTIHRDRHRTVDAMRARFHQNGRHLLSRGVDFLLYSIIDGVVDNYAVALSAFDERLQDLEERSFLSTHESVYKEATDIRRDLMELRRLAMSQQEALATLSRGECDYVAESLGRRFMHVSHHLVQVIELTDSLREVLMSIRENYQSGLTRRTNEIISTLTIFASILLPMSLVAGIYGMNLRAFPSTEHPWGFPAVLLIMGTLALGLGLFFKSRRWF
jgi:magnesium transporter